MFHALVRLASTAPLITAPKFVAKPCDSALPPRDVRNILGTAAGQ